MSEELYEAIPDVEAYLARIGVERPRALTLEELDALVFAHQRAVPFEDLDVCEKAQIVPLGIRTLFDKVVVRRRGGYCFELNALFGALLKALGFEVRPCMARILIRPAPHPLVSHRANIVTIEGAEYLVDVGLAGPQPSFALRLEDGFSRAGEGQEFFVRRHDNYWWDVSYRGTKEEERAVSRVCAMPVGEEDFIPLSFYQAGNPESVFRTTRIVNIRTADGAVNLRGTKLTVFAAGEKSEREISADELDRVLEEHFGIADWR